MKTDNFEKLTRWLLASGVMSGILFYGLAAIQILTRPGFDIKRHPISMLALGESGWIQIANFLATGILVILCAIGMRKILKGEGGRIWGPLLVGIHGLGLIIAGVFTADPAFGFPPGAPEGMPAIVSTHGALHGMGFFVAFTALIIACFVFARRFFSQKQLGLGFYSIATGVAAPLIIAISMGFPRVGSVLVAVNGIVTFSWLAVVSARFMVKM